jgi:hypothetical protein
MGFAYYYFPGKVCEYNRLLKEAESANISADLVPKPAVLGKSNNALFAKRDIERDC